MSETLQDIIDRHRVSRWGNGYFGVDADGHLRVHPTRRAEFSVRLRDIVETLAEQGVADPVMLRFPQILSDRRQRIADAFRAAIDEFEYPATYRGVFPVKVNHDRVVIETLVRSGYEDRFGLEVGSKAELCLALAVEAHPDAIIVCNGFKDADYLELAAHAAASGRRVMAIAENPREIDDIIAACDRIGRGLEIGLRARMHAAGIGRWQESTGLKGKFGLSSMEILEGLDSLDRAGYADLVRCLHFHIGSQVCDMLHIKEAIREASRLFCDMTKRLPRLEWLDLGGGLGIDYDGSRTATDWSVNYDVDEYARDAVWVVKDICDRSGVRPPNLITESGRALTAYHAVILLSSVRILGLPTQRDYEKYDFDTHQVRELRAALDELTPNNYREVLHDATALKNEVLNGFNLGFFDLEDRAVAECLYQDICSAVRQHVMPERRMTPDMIELEQALAPKHVLNFSVFMSAPDSWAVGQVFPVCPIDRLTDPRSRAATIGDITCDSDGKLERFIGEGTPENYIWLHEPEGDEPYHIGMFLVGAYQDVLGDFHNLFGTVNEGVIAINDRDDFSVVEVHAGSSVEKSLEYFGFDSDMMVREFERLSGPDVSEEYRGAFLDVLRGNTYMRPDERPRLP